MCHHGNRCSSWTGNLVTNNTWEHFWLNEGFTVFAERKILGALQGELARQASGELRWDVSFLHHLAYA